jgi:GNAT superfamily N-acetyltransferase
VKHFTVSGATTSYAAAKQNRPLVLLNCFVEADLVTALNWLAVVPSHRCRGVGHLLMDVGVQLADNLNLECWMEASTMGKPLYEKFAFQSLLNLAFDNVRKGASDEWRKCAHEMTPPPIFAMWRPKHGTWKSESGEDVKFPWDLGTT